MATNKQTLLPSGRWIRDRKKTGMFSLGLNFCLQHPLKLCMCVKHNPITSVHLLCEEFIGFWKRKVRYMALFWVKKENSMYLWTVQRQEVLFFALSLLTLMICVLCYHKSSFHKVYSENNPPNTTETQFHSFQFS